jgi:hypothetical protein
MPSAIDLAWTAGIVEGEGTISLQPGSGRGYRRPYVSVDNTDIEMLEELTRLFGGGYVAKRSSAAHHRQCWSWRVYGSDKVIAFLKQILPYMRCQAKADRARMLITEYKATTPRNGYYTPELRAIKEDFERRFFEVGAGRGSQCFPTASGE